MIKTILYIISLLTITVTWLTATHVIGDKFHNLLIFLITFAIIKNIILSPISFLQLIVVLCLYPVKRTFNAEKKIALQELLDKQMGKIKFRMLITINTLLAFANTAGMIACGYPWIACTYLVIFSVEMLILLSADWMLIEAEKKMKEFENKDT